MDDWSLSTRRAFFKKRFLRGISHPTRYLKGHLGANSVRDLMDDLCVEAAVVIHVTHQHREGLDRRGVVGKGEK